MGTTRYLDLEAWERREHFDFFRDYDNPFFNICADVDVSSLLDRCRDSAAPSFFLTTLFLSIEAANEVEEFRYRIRGDRVVVHDVIHGASTVRGPDDTFAFAHFDFDPDFERFLRGAEEALEVTARRERALEERSDRDDLIHHSVIPWIPFTSFSHARRWQTGESIPKIVFGGFHGATGAERMPVSIEVHHALMDGLHVARFLERFQHHLVTFPSLDR